MATLRHHPPLADPGSEHLHDAVGSDAEQARVHTVQVLFEQREQAETALDAIYETFPYPPDAVSVRPAAGVTAKAVDDAFEDDARATWRGAARAAAVGAPLGLLLGLTLEIGLESLVAVGLLTFAMAGFGAISGALVGLARSDPLDDDPAVEVTGGDDAVIVTLRHLRPWSLRRRLVAFGGLPIETIEPDST